jgi:integrase
MRQRIDSLAQQVEHNTFNVGVLGSSPRRITQKIRELLLSDSLFLCLFYAGLHGSVKPRVKPRMEATVNVTCYKSKVLKNGEIGEKLELPIPLTTYVARHSYATVLKRAGVSTAIISESLGHSSEKITQVYLDSFDNEQISNAMKNLL